MIVTDRNGGASCALTDALSGADCVARLESRLEDVFGKATAAVCSADAALHTALFLCDVKRGDYVFAPSFTFYSYIATVVHAGGVPIFLDCDHATRCVSPAALETALLWASLQDRLPKAVIIDNAFGAVADLDRLLPICKAFGVPTVELCCGAPYGNYKGKPCGGSGDYGVVGFNKRMPGGGAALVCGDDIAEARGFCRMSYTDKENHDYRLNNYVAALDCAQLDVAEKIAARSRKNLAAIAAHAECLAPTDGDGAEYAVCRAAHIMPKLRAAGYEVKKPPPVHTLPEYSQYPFFQHEQGYSVCESFKQYCLIGTDMSVFARIKLTALLDKYCGIV